MINRALSFRIMVLASYLRNPFSGIVHVEAESQLDRDGRQLLSHALSGMDKNLRAGRLRNEDALQRPLAQTGSTKYPRFFKLSDYQYSSDNLADVVALMTDQQATGRASYFGQILQEIPVGY